jgi:nicotinamide mononucleotide transporter
MSPVETIATAFGVLSVLFYITRSIWSWPTGLVQVALSIVTFYEVKLYSDMVLQIIYVPLQLYGWWHWLYGDKSRAELPITRITPAAAAGWLIAAAVLTAALGYMMQTRFGAAMAYPDAAIAVCSLIAQYLLARKVLENWAIWIAIDILALYVYFSKSLYLFTGLYAVFLHLAAFGLIAWIRAYHRQPPPPTARAFNVAPASSSASSARPTSGTATSPTSPGTSSTA